MRFIIYGVGAIGGTLAVKLTRAGHDVTGIARGAQLEAIRSNGLMLRTPDETLTAKFPCVAHPTELEPRPDDIVCLTLKSQDTGPALEALRDAGFQDQTIICMQNGVANEPRALRLFANVLGAMVNIPASYLVPGEVAAFCSPTHGTFDIGRYPKGTGPEVAELCDILSGVGFAAFEHSDVMRAKYGKLFINLANGVDSALGASSRDGHWVEKAREEARLVYEVAGIGFDDPDAHPERREQMRGGKVPGVEPVGSSAAQSLARKAGSVEVDYLNGEIAWLGRLHGVSTPVNAFFTQLSHRLARSGQPPGSVSEEDVLKAFEEWFDR